MSELQGIGEFLRENGPWIEPLLAIGASWLLFYYLPVRINDNSWRKRVERGEEYRPNTQK